MLTKNSIHGLITPLAQFSTGQTLKGKIMKDLIGTKKDVQKIVTAAKEKKAVIVYGVKGYDNVLPDHHYKSALTLAAAIHSNAAKFNKSGELLAKTTGKFDKSMFKTIITQGSDTPYSTTWNEASGRRDAQGITANGLDKMNKRIGASSTYGTTLELINFMLKGLKTGGIHKLDKVVLNFEKLERKIA